jgi:hypothetical protein
MKPRVGLLAGIATLAFASPAMAGPSVQRFAEPLGNGAEPCLLSDPCSLQTAVEAASPSAQVRLRPGTYIESDTVSVANDVDVVADQPEPDGVIIQSSAAIAVHVAFASGSSDLEDFTIDHNAMGVSAKGLHLEGGIGRRLFVDSTGTFACDVTSLLRDSICLNTAASGGNAAGLATPVDLFPQLINVTAVATSANGVGVFLAGTASGAEPILTGRNVIAEGALTDQFVSGVAGANASVVLSNSNFDSLFVATPGTATGTNTNVNDNQTDPELLDADYRQLPNSPTIDAGDNSFAISLGDIDGDTRIQGAAVDIGADEFVPVPPVGDTQAPETEITKKPKKKSTKRKAKLKFESSEAGSSFECKLDKKPFKACESPFKKKVKSGKKHKFKVRAIDAAGNADATPAKAKWKVLEKD